jgi:hypothetical protein
MSAPIGFQPVDFRWGIEKHVEKWSLFVTDLRRKASHHV